MHHDKESSAGWQVRVGHGWHRATRGAQVAQKSRSGYCKPGFSGWPEAAAVSQAPCLSTNLKRVESGSYQPSPRNAGRSWLPRNRWSSHGGWARWICLWPQVTPSNDKAEDSGQRHTISSKVFRCHVTLRHAEAGYHGMRQRRKPGQPRTQNCGISIRCWYRLFGGNRSLHQC